MPEPVTVQVVTTCWAASHRGSRIHRSNDLVCAVCGDAPNGPSGVALVVQGSLVPDTYAALLMELGRAVVRPLTSTRYSKSDFESLFQAQQAVLAHPDHKEAGR